MSEQEREARRARLEALRADGIDPYPAQVGPRETIAVVRERFDASDDATLEAEAPAAAVAGRILAQRSFGKLAFLELLENGVRLQVSLRKAEAPPEVFAFAKRLDVGDFIRVEGVMWRTKKGELTLDARAIDLLSKSLRPLPEKWHGLQDVEARYRQRHLDLLVNEDARSIAIARSRVVTAMRRFLDERDFLEVETPILQSLYGGAAARPFVTHHNSLDRDFYLRISDELYLKRLVVAGFDRVYEIGRNFRNEGISRKHSPEFTMMECYQAYADYRDMMDLTQAMLSAIAESVLGGSSLSFGEHRIELSGEWPRLPMCDAIRNETGVDVLAAPDLESLRKAVEAAGLSSSGAPTWATLVDDLFSDHVEPKLIQPTFLTDHPAELSPLAKRKADDPRLVERFEIYMAGFELGNAFSELNDPDDQRARFEEQRTAAAEGDAEAHPMDEDYLRTLEQGLPPTGGLGIGVDRLAMVIANAPNLRETILFPHLRGGGSEEPA